MGKNLCSCQNFSDWSGWNGDSYFLHMAEISRWLNHRVIQGLSDVVVVDWRQFHAACEIPYLLLCWVRINDGGGMNSEFHSRVNSFIVWNKVLYSTVTHWFWKVEKLKYYSWPVAANCTSPMFTSSGHFGTTGNHSLAVEAVHTIAACNCCLFHFCSPDCFSILIIGFCSAWLNF